MFFIKRINTHTGIKGIPVVVFNLLSWQRDGVVSIELYLKEPLESESSLIILDSSGKKQLVEKITILDKTKKHLKISFWADDVPSIGYATYYIDFETGRNLKNEYMPLPYTIENDYYKITVDSTSFGIISIYDKAGRKEILDTKLYYGNELCIQEDVGSVYCVQSFGDLVRLGEMVNLEKIENTGNVQRIVTAGSFEKNKWKQEVILYKKSPIIDFITEVDWNSVNKRMRIVFPTSIKKDYGFYEIPYGVVRRGKYEFKGSAINPDYTTCGDWPAQKWVEITDGDYGVTLINKGIPSHKIDNGIIYLSVLRSPTVKLWGIIDPFEGARDTGKHEFRYSLYPHSGDWRKAGTVRKANESNFSLISARATSHNGIKPAKYSFCNVKGDNIVVSSMKRSEKDNLVVFRLYNTSGEYLNATLTFDSNIEVNKTYKCNLLERKREQLSAGLHKINLSFLPYEISTLLIGVTYLGDCQE